MPLFMMISGYFAWSSMSLSPIDFVKKKIVQLLLPCLIWGVFISGMVSLFHFLCWKTFSIVDMASFIVHSFWFLKSLFLCYMLAYLGKKILPNAYWGIITIILSLMIDFLNLSIMYPCFFVGILLKSNDVLWKLKTRMIWITSLVIFVGLLCFWNKSFWDYRAFNFNSIFLEHENYPLIYLYRKIYRILIGIAGSFSFIFLFYLFFERKKQSKIFDICCEWGKYTLGIYILQTAILEIVMRRILNFDNLDFVPFNFVVAPFISVCVLVICVFIIKMINKHRVLSFLLFGK